MLTPDGRNRRTEWIMVAVSVASTALVVMLPRRAIARSRRRLTFFGGWSAFTCAFIALVSTIDGGPGSPLGLMIFVSMAYASLAYPPRLVAGIGALATGLAAVSGLATATPYRQR